MTNFMPRPRFELVQLAPLLCRYIMSTHIDFFSHRWIRLLLSGWRCYQHGGCGHIAQQRQGMLPLWCGSDHRLDNTAEFELHVIQKYMLSICIISLSVTPHNLFGCLLFKKIVINHSRVQGGG